MKLPVVVDDLVQSLIALSVLLVGAIVLRLVWVKVLVRHPKGEGMGMGVARSTATPVFLVTLAVGMQIIFARLSRVPRIRLLAVTPYLSSATYIFTILSFTWLAYGLVKGASEFYLDRIAPKTGSKLDTELVPALRRLAQILLIGAAVTVLLDHYHVKVTALLGAAGVASLAVALAAQDTIANMIAGFTIMIDRPFRLGDRVELANGRIGDVFEIGLRSTKILSFDHNMYIIPNSELAKSSTVNHSYPDDRRNVRQKIGVDYASDPEKVKRILAEICRSHPQVLRQPQPGAFVNGFGDSALQISFNYWIADFRQQDTVQDDICRAILARFEKEGIRLPPPQREVHLIREAGQPDNTRSPA